LSNRHLTLATSAECAGARLDVFLAANVPGLSRHKAVGLIEAGKVLVDGRRVFLKGMMLSTGQRVEVWREDEAAPTSDDGCPLAILYEDDELVAVDKPAGRHSAPQRAGETGTVAQALLARYPQMAGVGFSPREPGLCHRLDYWTSGVLLAAKSQAMFDAVRAAFERHEVRKEYLALASGGPPERFVVDAPIAHPARRAARVSVGAKHGRGAIEARTEFVVVQRGPAFTLLRAICQTGAMHQIRAHAAHAGFPLLGDEIYGGPPEPAGRFWLHAAVLGLARADAPLLVECILPADFAARMKNG